jgi:transcription initiation factor TFIIB
VIVLDICAECGGTLVEEGYEKVCSVCGLVASENRIIDEPDYNVYNEKEVRHTGSGENINVHDKSLSTEISKTNRDSCGRSVSESSKYQLFRLRRMQFTGLKSSERTLRNGLGIMNMLCDKLALPVSVRSRSSSIFRYIAENGLIRGRSIATMSVAAVYFSCRENQASIRSLDDLASASGLEKKDVARAFRFLLINVKVTSALKPYSFAKYIEKIGEDINVSCEKRGAAIKLLLDVQKCNMHLAGKDPKGLACAALYIVCKDSVQPVRQASLSQTAGVTEVTIRNRYKALMHVLARFDIKY